MDLILFIVIAGGMLAYVNRDKIKNYLNKDK